MEGFLLAFLAVAGWEAMRAGRLHPWLCWVDVAEAARELGWWFWTCNDH